MIIEITEKQAEYIREANHRWNLAIGAVRSGKSHIAIRYVIPQCIMERKGKKGIKLILGASKENIERNVLTPMRDMWGSSMVSAINSRNQAMIFGEKVYCIGAENVRQVSKIRGSEISFCYCDELVDINEEVFEMLKSRLSLPYSVCHAAANPSYPTHFVKRFIDSAEKGVDVWVQHYTIYDNPFLPESYVHALEAEYKGTVYYDRYIKGLWTQAEGLIYPGFQSVIKSPPDIPASGYGLSIDYGTQNAFAALLWAKRGQVWYAEKEYYYSGRNEGIPKTDQDYYKDMLRFIDSVPKMPIETIIDPSAASFIAVLARDSRFRVIPAVNDVANGIRETSSAMSMGKIAVSPACRNWHMEVEGYVWDKREAQDTPVKVNDHLMDSMRYFVKTKNLSRVVSPYYSPIEGRVIK